MKTPSKLLFSFQPHKALTKFILPQIKSTKLQPYLHESRHQHALNRVRGSGGRFLSTKKSQSSDSLPSSNSQTNEPDSFHFNYGDQADKFDGPSTAGEGSSVSDPTVDGMMQVADGRFSGLQPHMAVPMQGNGGFVYNGNRHYASIVR